jgi:hypothetical protein
MEELILGGWDYRMANGNLEFAIDSILAFIDSMD